ncbi:hypothetical protein OYT88_14345 [Sporolactobacillus sp. CQH2019]|uniref:spr1630 family ClpXP-sensitive toxin n=1 Tax=Sporolactobacillus sp. CQH2019 TaxID=3023512 RepID=UPI00236839BE|nr:hypothetical protein [Sporolactobacillus sp. CQH2019]MDD9149731.1 hypothetical protein [Sporolactobacillus sp. CQH2019]
MSKFDLPASLEQQLVNGIMSGYKSYLGVRRNAQEELAVSGAYAWVKGNHIDSSVKDSIQDLESVAAGVDKAGYTWEYLQFSYDDGDGKALIIVKNTRSTDRNFGGKPGRANHENYLYEYAGINNSAVRSGELRGIRKNRQIQLELSFPELEAIHSNSVIEKPSGFDRFYIVTYEIDDISKMISAIKLTMPNQETMRLVEIADLTPLIKGSGVTINEDELAAVKNDKIPEGVYSSEGQSFGYEVAGKEKEDNQGAQ